ncbi:Cj0069 family protein [Rhodocytophaga aerolata]|uniref:Cj0069 family protein n=1 Tax=Rhodocytophaga aerolata TaxID=455078 RepID=A0ABT8RBZ1_9BACT|nr:Cj0069 family protein [Rhodocytophaga aerolata]MDO1449617.1 Cj0069 family protein [Rhodocytophaga aerolata]
MKPYSIAILIYGEINSDRNALTEEKYKDLASAFLSEGFHVQSVLYNDESLDTLYSDLLKFDALLVWVNPIEQGKDRRKLDALLAKVSDQGCFVSTHPEVILKMGTKDILYKTKDVGWGSETDMYTSFEDFARRFPEALQRSGIKVLKQYRGNGGNGVYKIIQGRSADEVTVIHAKNSGEAKTLSWNDFYSEFKPYFSNNGLLIEQAWHEGLINGMVRCYVSGNKVAGFGYQEIVALYEIAINGVKTSLPPSKRYYFTQNCGLFNDLKQIMENSWIPQLQKSLAISSDRMPVIWDADFFINDSNHNMAVGKYTLCEINVSCVSPFPPSAIPFIVEEVSHRLMKKKNSKDYIS